MIGSTRTKLKPPPGSKTVKDWDGKRVALVREMSNRYGTLPAGMTGTVTWDFPHGLRFESDKCACCSARLAISGLDQNDVRILPGIDELPDG